MAHDFKRQPERQDGPIEQSMARVIQRLHAEIDERERRFLRKVVDVGNPEEATNNDCGRGVNQVLHVVITEQGTDEAIFMNGKLIVSADPDVGDVFGVRQTGKALAEFFDLPLVRCEWPAHSDWQWDEVAEDLKREGLLHAGPEEGESK